jgi:hypothetical protein
MVFKPGQSGNPGGRWKPGQSGNPGGRPKSRPLKDAIDRVLKKLGDGDSEKTMDEMAGVLVAKCMTGDIAAFKEFGDRYEGKVPTPIGGTDELPAIKGFSWIEPDKDESDLAKPIDIETAQASETEH